MSCACQSAANLPENFLFSFNIPTPVRKFFSIPRRPPGNQPASNALAMRDVSAAFATKLCRAKSHLLDSIITANNCDILFLLPILNIIPKDGSRLSGWRFAAVRWAQGWRNQRLAKSARLC
jgi:hypothetical protein